MPDELDAYLNPAPRPRRGTKLSSSQIADTLRQAGWEERHVPTMTAVALAESSGNPSAHNPKYPDDSYGLLQVNRLAHPEFSPETLRDPLRNAKAALNVFREKKQGFKAWTTFTSGAYKKHLNQSLQRPASDLDSYLDPPTSTEQIRPPSSAKRSDTSPAPATLEEALQNITRSTNEATEKLKRQAQRPESARDRLMRQSGQQRTIDQSQREQEAQLRTEAEAELKSRRGPYRSPTLTGALKVISDPIGEFQNIFKSDEEQINQMVGERKKQIQIAQEPEVVEQRLRYGQMSAPRRVVEAPLQRGGATLLKTAGGIASAFGIAPNQFSEWANRRGELIESAASLAPLQKKHNLTALITGDPELEEVERGVLEKIATGFADLGLSLGQIILLKKATKLSFPHLLALEAAAKNSNRPASEQLARAAEGYALGSSLERITSRVANAAVSGVPTTAQTGYEVSQGRMSPVDAAIQTGIQTGVGAALPPARRRTNDRPIAEIVDTSTTEELLKPRPEVLARHQALQGEGQRFQTLRDVFDYEQTLPAEQQQAFRAAVEADPQVLAVESAEGITSAKTQEAYRQFAERYFTNEPQIQTKPPVEAQRETVESEPPAATNVPARPAVDAQAVSDRGSEPETPQRFYHRDFGEVSESPNQRRVGKGRVRVVAEDGTEHVIKRAAMTGRGNERAVPVRSEPTEKPIDEYLEPSESAASPESRENITGIITKSVTEQRTEATAPKNAAMQADREVLGLPELQRSEPRSAQSVLDEAKARNAYDPRSTNRLVQQAIEGGKNFTNVETMQVNLRAAEIKNRVNELNREIFEAKDEPLIAEKRVELNQLVDEFDRLSQAQHAAGREWGRAGIARQRAIDEDYSLVSMVARFKAATGKEPTNEQRVKIEDLSRRNAELEVKLREAEDQIAKKRVQGEVDRVARRERRTQTRAQIDNEWSDLTKQFVEIRQNVGAFMKSDKGEFDPSALFGKEKVPEYSPSIQQAFKDWKEGRAYIDNAKNYRVKTERRSSGNVAAWNQEIKRLFPTVSDFHKAATAFIKSEKGAFDPEAVKLIGKMVRNRVHAGVTDAAQLVDDIHGIVGGDKRELRDVISGYRSSPAQRQSEIQRQINSLKSQLRQESKSEDIAAGRRSPRQEGPQAEFRKDVTRQRAIERQIEDLEAQMASSNFKEKAEREPPRYTRETHALQKQLDEVKAEYEQMKYRATASFGQKLADTAIAVGNAPKTMLSTGDFSALLRQGGYGSATHPVLSTRAAQDMLRSISERGFANVEAEIKSHPQFEEAKRNGVEFTGVDQRDPRLSKREEGYLGSGFIDTLSKGKFNPLRVTLKPIKDISERTFVSFLDSQRMGIYAHQAQAIKSMKGLTDAQVKDALKAQANLVNIATGRGSLGVKGNQIAPALNIAMFSPRLLASRVQLLNKMFNPVAWANTPKGARKLMMIDNAKFLGFTLFTLGLAKAAGASVSLDPDDSEFLKIKIGNTRYDTLTGLQQPMRMFLRMVGYGGGQFGGAMRGGETYSGDKASDILADFTRSKASPQAGYVWDAIEGKNRMSGKRFEAGSDALKMAAPLPLQDFQKAIETDGSRRGFIETLPALVGVGAQTYVGGSEKPTTHAEKLARRIMMDKMPDESRTQAEIDVDAKRSQLRARSRRGEDVSGELEQLRGKLTDRQIKAVLSARNKTRFQEDVNRLGIKDTLLVYSVANPQQRAEIKSLVERKAALVNTLKPEDQEAVRQKLSELGFSIPAMRISRPSRESRAGREARQ